jgi:YVTN family beta-propeller protein
LALVSAVAAVGLAAGTASASAGLSVRSSHLHAGLPSRWLRDLPLRGEHASSESAVPVGENPFNSALDEATHTLYVTNPNWNRTSAGTVSVLDTATCNALQRQGCSQTPPTVQVGLYPTGVVVDQATDTIYVTNYGANTVSVINGATCNSENTSGCSQNPPTVTLGASTGTAPAALDVNQETDTVYVANLGSAGLGTTVSVIDGRTCNGQVTWGCSKTPPTLTVPTGAEGVIVDESSDTIYVGSEAPSGAGTVSVINGATCNATVTTGCTQTPDTVRIGTGTMEVNVAFAIDQASDTLYAANSVDNTVSMINTATCNAKNSQGCSQAPKLVSVGATPIGISLNRATDTIYVANNSDNTVSVLDPATCNAIVTWGCGRLSGLLSTGSGPDWVTTDESTDTIYVPNGNVNTVSVLNGATCNSIVIWGCDPPTDRPGHLQP